MTSERPIPEFERGRIDAREEIARWMMTKSYATGHGDTIESLLGELEWQARRRGANREPITPA